MDIAIAVQMGNIWIPPEDRPSWVNNSLPNAGPHLTDAELDEHSLSEFKKYPFDEVWAESIRLIRAKNRR